MVEITIRPETYKLEPIRCITRDGIENTFYDVTVISSLDRLVDRQAGFTYPHTRDKVIQLTRKFGPPIKQTLVYDRIGEELRTFCANHTIDEVFNVMFLDVVHYVKRQVELSIVRLGEDGIR